MVRPRYGLALTTLPLAVPYAADAQLDISGQIDVVATTGYEAPLNRNFRRDDPFNEIRLRVFMQHWVTERIAVFGEILYDLDADVRVNGAYVVVNEIAGKPWLNSRIGMAPSLFGSFGFRGTYFNQNPLIGVPAGVALPDDARRGRARQLRGAGRSKGGEPARAPAPLRRVLGSRLGALGRRRGLSIRAGALHRRGLLTAARGGPNGLTGGLRSAPSSPDAWTCSRSTRSKYGERAASLRRSHGTTMSGAPRWRWAFASRARCCSSSTGSTSASLPGATTRSTCSPYSSQRSNGDPELRTHRRAGQTGWVVSAPPVWPRPGSVPQEAVRARRPPPSA